MEGKELRRIRFETGLSQKEFARRLGFHQSYISFMEIGTKPISAKTVFKIKQEFGA
ncbi:helix-turn-helix domain-containing protein [Halobacillus naozhouensis]|uniref:Helix-turn-helix transcriptional regulator n=1 Tax=Halobacillus naozhouensis TaxID=554880 RepID=A0ABY8IZZ9_9BACI|nr:helix-turn-helix transcriptional regulator [Halobacillus naozhouensis]WFT74884.1 helix-turn-helix transcriptional regulator [Halobacillus naozhouensis]